MAGREGRLELEGILSYGCLVDGTDGETGCLVWQPRYGESGSAIDRGVTGRIVYRDRPSSTAKTPTANAQGRFPARPQSRRHA